MASKALNDLAHLPFHCPVLLFCIWQTLLSIGHQTGNAWYTVTRLMSITALWKGYHFLSLFYPRWGNRDSLTHLLSGRVRIWIWAFSFLPTLQVRSDLAVLAHTLPPSLCSVHVFWMDSDGMIQGSVMEGQRKLQRSAFLCHHSDEVKGQAGRGGGEATSLTETRVVFLSKMRRLSLVIPDSDLNNFFRC